jgi:hypothetical protein
MMEVDLQVTLDLKSDIKQSVPGKLINHMVKKGDPCQDLGLTSSVHN